MEKKELIHLSVLLNEFLEFTPARDSGALYLDVTAGGAGHVSAFLEKHQSWIAEAWDRDPDAKARVQKKLQQMNLTERCEFFARDFGKGPRSENLFYDYILADLGVSSFQLDDMSRGMSLHSEEALDFRMDPSSGLSFVDWLGQQDERKLTEIFYRYAEEPKSMSLARHMKSWGQEVFVSAKALADQIARTMRYKEASRKHPATRIFQALRIAINDELGQLDRLLDWAPKQLKVGGRLAIMTFHSLEDRRVKQAFRDLEKQGGFTVLTPKPIAPTQDEESVNPRSRSAKLRVLEKQ